MPRCAILGLGQFGRTLAVALSKAGFEVIAVDNDRAAVEAVRDTVALAVRMDSTDEDALKAQGVDRADVAIVCMGTNFEANTLTTLLLKQLKVPHLIARATTPERGRILSLIGADEVVSPEEETALAVARRLVQPNILDYIALGPSHSVVEIKAPRVFWGKSLAALDVRKRYQVHILAIKRGGEALPFPAPEDLIQEGDTLVAAGASRDLARLNEG
jgi:trk system potassium uptake protein TrkA